MWDVLFILFLNCVPTRGIIHAIHALSPYILPTAFHRYPSFPLRMLLDCVFYRWGWSVEALCVKAVSLRTYCIFKLSYNRRSVSYLTAANCGGETDRGSVWRHIPHFADVHRNLSPRGGVRPVSLISFTADRYTHTHTPLSMAFLHTSF